MTGQSGEGETTRSVDRWPRTFSASLDVGQLGLTEHRTQVQGEAMKRSFAGRRGRFSSVVSIAKSLWQSREAECGPTERRRRLRAGRLEQLEPRTMLAADFVITEFMASNDGTLLDEDGDTSDWIEIQNVGN